MNFQKGNIDILSQLTCVEKENEVLYVFWHALNRHLQCKRQQTSEPEKLKEKINSERFVATLTTMIRKILFGNSQFLGMEFLVILLDPENL
jgi:hypothetical protein